MWLLFLPRLRLYAGIWGAANSWTDLAIMFLVGCMGYLMRVYDFPIAPVLIGLILGPMAEVQLRRALAIGQGDPMVLVSTPLSAVLVAVAVVIVVLPAVMHWHRSRKMRPA